MKLNLKGWMMIMQLNEDNYYSSEANNEYMSVSQLKSFIGVPAFMGCESRALAELSGEYVKEKTDALLVGSYVDIALTGTEEEMEQFKKDNPQIFSSRGETKGQLLAKYQNANKMIERVKQDELFMKTLSGKHQVIMTGTIYDVPFKIKIDSLLDNAIVDLKTCESITKAYYDAELGQRVSFIPYMNYILQGAIYQEIVRQNTGKTLPFFLSCVSKEKETDIEVIQIDNETLHDELVRIEPYVRHVQMLKDGEVEPLSCGCCEYCRQRKKLKAPISWLEIGGIV